MNKTFSAYEKIIFIKLFGIYLIANFSLPLIEGIHFILHLGDDTEIHSYSSHTNNHSHTTLNIIGQITNYQNSKHTSTTTESIVKVKKNIQCRELVTFRSFVTVLHTKQEFVFIANYTVAPFLSLTSPPPKSKYLL